MLGFVSKFFSAQEIECFKTSSDRVLTVCFLNLAHDTMLSDADASRSQEPAPSRIDCECAPLGHKPFDGYLVALQGQLDSTRPADEERRVPSSMLY